jgi:hypothetical protein
MCQLGETQTLQIMVIIIVTIADCYYHLLTILLFPDYCCGANCILFPTIFTPADRRDVIIRGQHVLSNPIRISPCHFAVAFCDFFDFMAKYLQLHYLWGCCCCWHFWNILLQRQWRQCLGLGLHIIFNYNHVLWRI